MGVAAVGVAKTEPQEEVVVQIKVESEEETSETGSGGKEDKQELNKKSENGGSERGGGGEGTEEPTQVAVNDKSSPEREDTSNSTTL